MNNENEIKRLDLYMCMLEAYRELAEEDYIGEIHYPIFGLLDALFDILSQDKTIKALKLVEEEIKKYKDSLPVMVEEVEEILGKYDDQ